MKVLITGIAGSGASYLAEYIAGNFPSVEIHGIARWHSGVSMRNLEEVKEFVQVHECDLNDLASVIRVLQSVKPDKIFNLASHANVRVCFDTPIAVLQNNIMSTANLLEAVRMVCPETIFQQCSTSEVYGNPMVTPIKESHAVLPVNPYAVSKLSQEALCFAYFKSWGIKAVITRAFAYVNPRRKNLFSTDFAYQIAEIEAGQRQTLAHGNLNSIRTLMDVRDMARAYWLASEQCEYGVPYNIGSIEPISVQKFLEMLCYRAECHIFTEQNPNLLRPVDMTMQICDATKFNNLTGFKAENSLEESIDFLLAHVREEVNCRYRS